MLLHKRYVYRIGVRLGVPRWRLLLHDWSKFLPSEWRAYVAYFYGPIAESERETRDRQADFNRAWLFHTRRNKHHWQYWVMRLDDGREITLLQEQTYALEMIADWMGAGTKIRNHPTLGECARETLLWYREHASRMLLRAPARATVEIVLTNAAQTWP